jgi:hypothetical protein
VEHRGALNLLNLDHEGQVQEVSRCAYATLAAFARFCRPASSRTSFPHDQNLPGLVWGWVLDRLVRRP